ncbi:zinc finger protein [Macleaya cordata]|uniref:Zinc finger protein n=1 Tax=Macleaya cordata TaxID=56857 RepID=A0A200R563_MACCD|nr:zinc finger protein [Macleaya cordata]
MEFWGVEVKSGQPLKVEPGVDKLLHLSQASLGEAKNKANESIPLFLNIDGQRLVLGTLSPEKCTHISYDLVFEKEFELSHNWKNGSVYFCGYKSVVSEDYPSEDSDDSDSGEEDIPLVAKENGKPEPKDETKAIAGKAGSAAAKPKVKIVEPNKDDKSKKDDSEEDDSEDDDSEDGSDDDESDDEDILAASDDSDDDEGEDDSSDEEDEATPKKAEPSKKRPAESATKTPAEKKAKLVTPQKTGADGKKGGGGHTATPHPAKQAGKTPANSDKSKQQTPKSAGGQVSCNTCSKTFNSEKALESHSKAKHAAK